MSLGSMCIKFGNYGLTWGHRIAIVGWLIKPGRVLSVFKVSSPFPLPRTPASLLRARHRRQLCVVVISTLYFSTFPEYLPKEFSPFLIPKSGVLWWHWRTGTSGLTKGSLSHKRYAGLDSDPRFASQLLILCYWQVDCSWSVFGSGPQYKRWWSEPFLCDAFFVQFLP